MADKSKKPKGLSITRKDNEFTLEWKTGEKYEKQTVEYKEKESGKWWRNWKKVPKTIKGSTTKVTVSELTRRYVPTVGANLTFDAIEFRVKGKAAKKDYSEWAKETYNIKLPSTPTLSAEFQSTNVTKFTWSVPDSDNKNAHWATKLTVDTILVANSAARPSRGWSSHYSGSSFSGSWNAEENTARDGWLNGTSYTRWVTVRSWGPQGNSKAVDAKHVYAKPYAPSALWATSSINTSGGTNVTVTWKTNSTGTFPVDSCAVEYMIGTPLAGMVAPSGSWSSAPAGTVKDPDNASHTFVINERPTTDQCLWVRVVNKHDEVTTPSTARWVCNGSLATPGIEEIDVNPDTKRATVKIKNNSSVSDSFVALILVNKKDGKKQVVAIYPHGTEELSGISLSGWNGTDPISFGVQAFVRVGYITPGQLPNINAFSLTSGNNMQSEYYQMTGDVPLPPANVSVNPGSVDGTAVISWTWNWSDATAAELSWADHEDAWESTDEPTTYVVNSTKASSWNISGLSVGTVWYIRIRFLSVRGEVTTYGVYSKSHELNLTSAPATPSLELIPDYVTVDGTVTAAWGYVSTDGTPQMAAEIDEVTIVNNERVYTRIAETETAQHVLISPSSVPESIRSTWTVGSTHSLVLKLKSGSQVESDWSVAKPLTVLDPVTVSIVAHPFVSRTIVIDEDTDETRTDETSLVAMPFNITVTGAGTSGETHISIVRTVSYMMPRPDDTEYGGVEGETILSISNTGEGTFTISNDDLVGYLDDGAFYTLLVSVSDEYGQVAEADPIDFIVHWDHQAKVPDGLVEIDEDYDVAYLTPIAPTAEAGEDWTLAGDDVCDIYRLSTDRPELVVPDAVWGTKYVDPYPAIGENGGYRFVFRTGNNDFITAQNEIAWTDIESGLYILNNIIDFGGDRADIIWNVDLSSAWKKDFKETQYLGGSVVGDWNPAVSRTGSVTGVVIKAEDNETIRAMRRLATHASICHIRTVDGSSYAADVQVSESRGHEPSDLTVNFTLNVTRVDTEEPDGKLYADWYDETVAEPEEE